MNYFFEIEDLQHIVGKNKAEISELKLKNESQDKAINLLVDTVKILQSSIDGLTKLGAILVKQRVIIDD